MANYISAEVTIYGKEEKREKLIEHLKEEYILVNIIDQDSYWTELQLEMKWTLDNLEKLKDFCKDNRVAIEAHGIEKGAGFFQHVAISHTGEVTNKSIELVSTFFEEEDD